MASPCQRIRLDFSISLSDASDGIDSCNAFSVASSSAGVAAKRSIHTNRGSRVDAPTSVRSVPSEKWAVSTTATGRDALYPRVSERLGDYGRPM